jgi:uncharacterized protein (UPF0264 family)
MKVLISPISIDEARHVCDGGADIVDIKNVKEGSLGASFPWIIRSIIESLRGENVSFSATLGDLPNKPGTASLAAAGAAQIGVDYVKAGLFGVKNYDEALPLMAAVVKACREIRPNTKVVAAGYADFRRFGGLAAGDLVSVANDARADMVMVDTAIKDGKTLFDNMSPDELENFISSAHEAGMGVALAGSIRFDHLDALKRLQPDLIGVRGCVCGKADRTSTIEPELVREFVRACRAAASTAA